MSYQNVVYVVGTGAIGKALAVFLKITGRNVVLIRASVDDGSSKKEYISVEAQNRKVYGAEIEIATLAAFRVLKGIIVLASKSYGNKHLAAALKVKANGSPVILLQNGLGIEQPFIENDFPEVYRCVLFVTSQSTSSTTVRFRPVAISPIGIEKGSIDVLNYIVEQLHTIHFEFKCEYNIQRSIWKKVIVNSVFNSVCPLLEIDNGIFYRNIQAFDIARRIISECVTIAGDRGVLLSKEEVEKSLLLISRHSEGQLISTLQDIRNNRQTEIETMNLEIARIAQEVNKQESVRETRLLGDLIKLKAEIQRHLNDN